VIAYLRRQPREEGYDGRTSIGPIGHLGIAMGRFRPTPEAMDHGATRLDPGVSGDAWTRGRYLVTIACTECHGAAFEGGLEGRAPPLAIVQAYTDENFRHLLRTGQAPGGRDLYLMDDVARSRFSHLTDDEITAMLTFLRRRPR
jgi:cytochrome c553